MLATLGLDKSVAAEIFVTQSYRETIPPPLHSFSQGARGEDDAVSGLSVVVVHGSGDQKGQPGDGFFKLAQELGRDTRDRLQFWATEFERVRRTWRRART